MTSALRLRWFIPFVLAGSLLSVPAETPAVQETPPTVEWQTDYPKALEQARNEHKLVLLDFTGSDWCIWCHRLHDEVLSQKAFLGFARDRLILVELDFPRKKPVSPELKKQNADLAVKFSVDGYPTILLVDADGRELGRTGYMEGGAKTFVRELKRFAAQAAPAANQ